VKKKHLSTMSLIITTFLACALCFTLPCDFVHSLTVLWNQIHFFFRVMTKFYQHILAFVFAIDEINEDPRFLPNVSLGFHIFDSYTDSQMTFRTTLDLLFNSHQFIPNYKCGIQKNVVAVIGGLSADTSSRMADISSVYKIPQVGPEHGHSSSTKSTVIHTSHSRLIKLFLHFQWKWIGLMAVDDEGGDHFLQAMVPLLLQNRICSAFVEHLEKNIHIFDKINDILLHKWNAVQTIMASKATTIVLHGDSPAISWKTLSATKVWITTAQIDFTSNAFLHFVGN
uniref:Receptor ligand binding region domain-containing protein n=1 Tax=Varanus komodoensis TaxID=61221 RepID=A0A8D2IQY7_VARKO